MVVDLQFYKQAGESLDVITALHGRITAKEYDVI